MKIFVCLMTLLATAFAGGLGWNTGRVISNSGWNSGSGGAILAAPQIASWTVASNNNNGWGGWNNGGAKIYQSTPLYTYAQPSQGWSRGVNNGGWQGGNRYATNSGWNNAGRVTRVQYRHPWYVGNGYSGNYNNGWANNNNNGWSNNNNNGWSNNYGWNSQKW